ncbi:unannotated protein [freshwater metagenome]|uniref:Unannotated protein n=1 Tax=freshwater metagenome TaxID=449393 RepID=A0A6J7DFJ7_9ZZZZ
MILVILVRRASGPPSSLLAPHRTSAGTSAAGNSEVMSTVAQPASRRVSTADQLTSCEPTTTARVPPTPWPA